MLSEDEQQAAIAALAAESDSEKSIDDNEQREPDDE
jgi:hypothetical protein